MGAVVTDPPGVPSMRRVSGSDPRLSGHPQIWSEAFSAGSGVGSFGSVGFSGKDVHVARLRALSAALLTAALLSAVLGCEDEPEPDIADPTPSSTAPSPSETQSSPTTSPTPEALTPEETVRAWVDARNQALQDGDTGAVRALSSSECRSCDELIKPIEQIYAAGGNFDTAGWSIAGIRQTSNKPIKVSTGIDFAAGTTISEPGAPPVVYEAEKHAIRFELVRSADALQVSLVLFLS
jgi:hypothetical protein